MLGLGLAPGLALASCALPFPDYELAQGGGGAAAGGGGSAPLAPNGAACAVDRDCREGHCLPSDGDGGPICCASACTDEGPESCGANGRCDPGGASCAIYPAGTICSATRCQDSARVTDQCEDGICVPGESAPCPLGLVCEDETSCKESCATVEDCATPGALCTRGQCIQPLGAPCSADDLCQSGICGIDGTGHCCALACDPVAEPCGATDCNEAGDCMFPGALTPCGSTPMCIDSQLHTNYCQGDGSCADAPSEHACADHLGCESGTSCFSACGSDDEIGDARCADGYWCDGTTCQPAAWDEHSPCERDAQCRSDDCAPDGCVAAGCDLDGDGVLREDAQCGGTDCDDDDARVYPLQTAYFDTPRTNGGYDFNCDGIQEPKLPTTCSCPGNVLVVPPGAEGCGVTGPIKACFGTLFFCVPNAFVNNAIQTCR